MICGKPVIASRLGGSLELVKEGETGLLFEAGNAEDLKNKVAFFFEHPEKIVEFGENAKRTMKNYSFDKIIVAPEARADLVQLLQKENCGLYYTEQNTAFAYVSYLLDRPHLMQNLKIRSRAADF